VPNSGLKKDGQLVGGPGLSFVFGIDRKCGAWAMVATLRFNNPRRMVSPRAPRMIRWISSTFFGGQGLGPGVGGVKFRAIQRFELVDLEPTNGNTAERGKDVAFDLAPVAVPGRLRQLVRFAWRPLADQKGAKCE